jgi:hypothetical protein
MFSGRWTVADLILGESTVIRGSGRMIAAATIASVILLWFAWGALQPPPSGCSSCSDSGVPGFALWILLALFCWFVALAHWRTQLVIGDRGFRWEKPWRPLQTSREVSWSEVSACEVDGTFIVRNARNWLVVTLSNGGQFKIGRAFSFREFSASWWEICDLMEDRRKAFQIAHPEGHEARLTGGQ